VTDQQTANRQPVVVKDKLAHLPGHLRDGRAHHLRIIRHAQEPARPFTAPHLGIGHIDVDNPVHQRQAVEAVIRTGVVHDRQPQPGVDRVRHRLEDLRDHVFGRHEIDVVATVFLKLQHHLRQPLRGDPLPAHPFR
jgi:hypothetical protein